MGIRTTQTKRTYTSATRETVLLPFGQLCIDVKRTISEIEIGTRLLKVQAWRYLLVLERQNSFDQPRHTRRSIQMTNIRFDRAESTELFLRRTLLERFYRGSHLDRVAQRCCRSMRTAAAPKRHSPPNATT